MSGLDVNAPSFKLWQALITRGATEDEATELMNSYAHELAERIRAEKGSGSYEPAELFRGGMDFAADLIDPEARP